MLPANPTKPRYVFRLVRQTTALGTLITYDVSTYHLNRVSLRKAPLQWRDGQMIQGELP